MSQVSDSSVSPQLSANPKGNSPLVTKKARRKKRRKMLSSFSILLLIIAFLVFLSWILHWAGVTSLVPRQVSAEDPADPDKLKTIYETKQIKALGVLDILWAPIKGFIKQGEIAIFVLVVGGFIYIVVQSKSLEGFSQSILRRLRGKELYAIVPIMLFFAICGSVEGMAEETLGFYAFSVPLMMLAGFDTMTGFLIVFLGAAIGVVGSTVTPFSVINAINALNDSYHSQGGTGDFISVGDGLVWRFVTWFVVVAAGITFVSWYAWRVKKNPQLSVTFKTIKEDKEHFLSATYEKVPMTWKRKLTLATFGVSYLIMIIYLIDWDKIFGIQVFGPAGVWVNENIPYLTGVIPGLGHGYLPEVTTFFLLATIILGVINSLGEEKFLNELITGAADLLSVVLVVGTAAGIAIVLQESYMQTLVLDGLGNAVSGIGSNTGKVLILFLFFIPISVLIPSTSGFSTAIFPLLLNVVGVKQGSTIVADPVLASGSIAAFVQANGWVNLFTPTSSVVLGGLALARISYVDYLKFIWKFAAVIFCLLILMLSFGSLIGGLVA